MELEFRNKKGDFLFSLVGEFAKGWFNDLQTAPEFVKGVTNFKGKGNIITLTAIAEAGYKISVPLFDDSYVFFVLEKGGYIKVLNK